MSAKESIIAIIVLALLCIVFKKSPSDLCISAYNAVTENLFSTKWEPGTKHRKIPHIHATKGKGLWAPDEGYVWATTYDQDWKTKKDIKEGVEWESGLEHSKYDNIQSSTTEGEWEPDLGYKFKNDDPGDLEVVKVPVKRTLYYMLP